MTQPSTPTIPPSLVPFLAVGSIAVVAGGIAAAVTGPTGWEHGSWVAAFLVLVTGVGQIGLGAGQAALTRGAVTLRRIATEVALLNGGCLLVIAGTLASTPTVVTIGGVALAGALGLLACTPHHHRQQHAWIGHAYTGLLLVLLVSIPIGLTLAWLRA